MEPITARVDGLIGHIYNDVTEKAPWRATLDGLCNAVSAQTLVLQRTRDGRSEQTHFLAAGVRTAPGHIAEWERRSRDQQISLALAPGRILTCNDYLAQRPREGFAELIRRYDVGRGMSASVTRIGDANYSLHALRPGRAAPFGATEEALFAILAPHLARAIGLRAMLAASRARDAAYGAALDRIGIGMVTVADGEGIEPQNESAAALLCRAGLIVVHDALHATDRIIDVRLQSAIVDAWAADGAPDFVASLALADGLHAIVRSTPVEDPTIGRRIAGATLLIHETRPAPDHAATLLRGFFGLTATEAQVAIHLVNGRSHAEIQALMGIRYSTLRSHIAEMFVKLDCNRLPELVSRLASAVPLLH